MNRILIVESDASLMEKLGRAFIEITTVSCGTLRAARTAMEQDAFPVVVVDEHLEDGNGVTLLKEIRERRYSYENEDISVIMLVENNNAKNIDRMLRLGADDCVTKPFSTAALKARIATQFKKKKMEFNLEACERFVATGSASVSGISGEHMVAIDKYIFDFDCGKFSYEGQIIELSRLEQVLLRVLIENKGVVLKRGALVERIRTETREDMNEDTLANTVRILSVKLHAGEYIKIVFGIGYFWIDKQRQL
ncbi:MAG: response regulator transcription factor [Roseburia sp.]|nr:response regulator transcription factor [Roseburia sp.]